MSCELSTLGEIIHAKRHESTPHNGTSPFTSVELFSTELLTLYFYQTYKNVFIKINMS
jgi:hypothetical protein